MIMDCESLGLLVVNVHLSHAVMQQHALTRVQFNSFCFLVKMYFKCESAGECHRKFQCLFAGQPILGEQIRLVT
jgi:hypothetical protein